MDWGIFDRTHESWVGNRDGLMSYTNLDVAKTALRVVNDIVASDYEVRMLPTRAGWRPDLPVRAMPESPLEGESRG